jgi:hypothetical protein
VRHTPSRSLDRRAFLSTAGGLTAAALLEPGRILADPYSPLHLAAGRSEAIRVRGRVVSAGRGLTRVGVTDGRSVVRTDREGRFELVTSTDRPFVSCSLPSGHAIPLNPSGTARFYEPIRPNAQGEMDVRFALEPLDGGDERHTMLLLPDVQTENAWEMDRFHALTVPDAHDTVRSVGERHAFGIACGDIMYDDLSLYPEYERGVKQIGAPFFQVVGNHDLDYDGRVDEESTRTFSRHFGPRYYSFDRGSVHYVVMDDVFYHGAGYVGYVQQDQLRWLEEDLAGVEAGRTVIVALHIPVLGTGHIRRGERYPGEGVSVTNRDALYRALEPYEVHILCGHTHENDHNYLNGVHEHVSGTVCGAWWSGPICADGAPHGYSVYDVDGAQVRWRYKSTGHDVDHQIRAVLPGGDPRAPQELVANVWDADEGWTVVWYEDGERRGRMARRVGFDPVSLRIHPGDELPPRRTWVEPYPRWLYYAPASPDAGEIRVEATDRFGRTYTTTAGPVPEDMHAWPV